MKLFVILSRVPWPLEKGDKLRAYHQLKELKKNHHIILCCLNDAPLHPEATEKLQSICNELHIFKLTRLGLMWQVFMAVFSTKPFQVAYFYRSRIHAEIKKLLQYYQPDHIYCQLIRTAEYVKNEHSYKKTLDYQDAFSKGMARRLQDAPFLFRWIMNMERKRLTIYENLIFEYFENKTIISRQDRNFIMHHERKKIEIVPNGVDTDFFRPLEAEKRFDLVFTGNMSYPPNIDCAMYLVKKVLPLARKTTPGISLLIAGADPLPQVKELEGNGVTISGWIEDIRTAYAGGKIFIAPMQLGSGLQNKLLEAMAMGIPCITSPLANNALGAEAGKEIAIGNTPEELAEIIFQLLNDKDRCEQMAEAGRKFVTNNFNWKSSTDILDSLILTAENATSTNEGSMI